VARFFACVSQALTKMVGGFAYYSADNEICLSRYFSHNELPHAFYIKVVVMRKFNYIYVATRNELAVYLDIPIKKLTYILYKKRLTTAIPHLIYLRKMEG